MATKAKIHKANSKPKFSCRSERRCQLCGRPRAVYRKFQLCRICFRKMAATLPFWSLPNVLVPLPPDVIPRAMVTDGFDAVPASSVALAELFPSTTAPEFEPSAVGIVTEKLASSVKACWVVKAESV